MPLPNLQTLQSDFCAAIFNQGVAEQTLLAALDGAAEVSQRGLAAYRRSIFGNLGHALQATYPVLFTIVGGPFFREVARQYLLSHASLSGDLNDYGGKMAEFLAAYPHAQDLPYLPDVARLEWAIQSVYYAAETPEVDLSLLATTPPERYGELGFTLNPATARIDSPWPLSDIWRVNQEGFAGDMHLNIDLKAGSPVLPYLVLRQAGLVRVEALSQGQATLWHALQAGMTLNVATEQALAQDPDFDLAAALQAMVAAGLLLGAELKAA